MRVASCMPFKHVNLDTNPMRLSKPTSGQCDALRVAALSGWREPKTTCV